MIEQPLPTPKAGVNDTQRLIVVSNREPYTVKINEEEDIRLEKTPGGLVSALDPVLRACKGLWICWEGATHRVEEFDETPPTLRELSEAQHISLPYEIKTVALSESEINHYYHGYANARLWPLFHYFPNHCDFSDPLDWPNYKAANQKFADTIVQESTDDDCIWIQDYHLFLVPGMVRSQAPNRKIGFFCHIPFPNYEVFRVLPKRLSLLKGLLGSDLIGFHTPRYVKYFLETIQSLLPTAVINWEKQEVHFEGRVTKVDAFPISIDYNKIVNCAQQTKTQEKAAELRQTYSVELLGIGVDRLDYSKGILERLEAIRIFFEKYPEYKKKMTFIQIASPTRTEVKMYQEMKEQVDQAVGRINGLLSEENWSPIQYFYRSVPLEEIVPYFAISDFCLITPLRDGMNLVAKEYCAARLNHDGFLVLSEFTGAAHELKESFFVNPYDPEEVADKIYEALQTPQEILQKRMEKLRRRICENDIHHWVQSFLTSFKLATHDKQP